jgi:hypothetical protein
MVVVPPPLPAVVYSCAQYACHDAGLHGLHSLVLAHVVHHLAPALQDGCAQRPCKAACRNQLL